MKITKKQMPKGTRVQGGKSSTVNDLEDRWLRRWEDYLFTLLHPVSRPKINVECVGQYLLDSDDHPFDFAFLVSKILIEIQGGQHMSKSGHTNAAGQDRDALKTRLAAERGWRVMTWTTNDIEAGRGFDQLAVALGIIALRG